jgi:hypothetical protein
MASRVVTDHQARSVSEVVYHCIHGGGYCEGCPMEQVLAFLTSLRFIEVRFMLQQQPELILDFQAARRRVTEEKTRQAQYELEHINTWLHEDSPNVCTSTSTSRMQFKNYEIISKKLSDFEEFVVESSADLLARPSNTLQTAANLPKDRTPAIAAAEIVKQGKEIRPWLR